MILELEKVNTEPTYYGVRFFLENSSIELALNAEPAELGYGADIKFFDHIGKGSVLEHITQLMLRDMKVMFTTYKLRESRLVKCHGGRYHISHIKTVTKEVDENYRGIQELVVTLSASSTGTFWNDQMDRFDSQKSNPVVSPSGS